MRMIQSLSKILRKPLKTMINELWIEKYRPKTLEDLCVSSEIKETIKGFGENIPNLLFCGVQGTGKTTLAKIIVCDILNCDYLYVNASDETGIDTIRNKVGGFAQTKSLDGNLKVVILDEADFLSINAQAALRNTMESYSDTTRFILTGNYKHKIIPALQSRCQSLDIIPDYKMTLHYCVQIMKKENIKIENSQVKNIPNLIKSYFPDVRKCINELSKRCVGGVLRIENSSNNNNICSEILKQIDKKRTLELRKYLIENQNLFNSDWDQLLIDLLNEVYDSKLSDIKRKAMMIIIADHLEKSVRVLDKEINFFACVLRIEDELGD